MGSRGRRNVLTFGLGKHEEKKHSGCFTEWLRVAKEQNQITGNLGGRGKRS